MPRRQLKWLIIVFMTMFVSGCAFHGSVRWDVTYYTVSGVVRQWPLGMPLQNAEVFFNGKVDVRKVTDEYGAYTAYLPAGTYRVTIRTPYVEHRETVRIEQSGRLDLHVEQKQFRDGLFAALSGMRRYDIRGGVLHYEPGVLERWAKSRVSLFFQVENDVPSWLVPVDWHNTMYSEAKQWEQRLQRRISFQRTYTPNADIRITLVPPNVLGNYQAVHERDSYDGRLEQVRLWIDVNFIHDASLREHELAHALGIYHSYEAESIMYPQVTPNQRNTFTGYELDLIRLMYDSQPGMQYGNRVAGGLSLQSADRDERQPLVEQADVGALYTAHAITLDGEKVELTADEVEAIRNGL